jgi:hypothetical protein
MLGSIIPGINKPLLGQDDAKRNVDAGACGFLCFTYHPEKGLRASTEANIIYKHALVSSDWNKFSSIDAPTVVVFMHPCYLCHFSRQLGLW